MKSFLVMPMDQHLTLNGIAVPDDAATLCSLGIRLGSVYNTRISCDSYMEYPPSDTLSIILFLIS